VAAGVDSSYPKIVTVQAEPCLLYQWHGSNVPEAFSLLLYIILEAILITQF
jgi:hypothetical protein